MNKPNYSKSEVVKLATVNEARQRYRLSRGMVTKIASDNNALMKIGNCVRIDVSVLDNALKLYNQ